MLSSKVTMCLFFKYSMLTCRLANFLCQKDVKNRKYNGNEYYERYGKFSTLRRTKFTEVLELARDTAERDYMIEICETVRLILDVFMVLSNMRVRKEKTKPAGRLKAKGRDLCPCSYATQHVVMLWNSEIY